MGLSQTYLDSIEAIKKAGFGWFKLELEAHFRRAENGRTTCGGCGGGGTIQCIRCNANGFTTRPPDGVETLQSRISRLTDGQVRTTYECETCLGEGNFDCERCGGIGSEDVTSWNLPSCQQWMKTHVSEEAQKALVFGSFYADGSVDSEFTFTLPIDKAYLALEYMQAFIELGNTIGRGIDTHNAGMHMSVLPTSRYPCPVGKLNPAKMLNFRNEVTKMLPGLYFLASPNKTTRGLGFRLPRVSENDKYSAIFTHGDRCIEYRIFDTCYDKPQVMLDNIEVIARTLEYYSDKKFPAKFKRFQYIRTDKLSDVFGSVDNLDALDASIEYIKPSNKSVEQLKKERGLTIKRATLVRKLKQQMDNYQAHYERYIQGWTQEKRTTISLFMEDFDIAPEADEALVIQMMLDNNSNYRPIVTQPLEFAAWYGANFSESQVDQFVIEAV